MKNSDKQSRPNDPQLAADIVDVAGELDRLGAADRAHPALGFEVRIAAATQPGLFATSSHAPPMQTALRPSATDAHPGHPAAAHTNPAFNRAHTFRAHTFRAHTFRASALRMTAAVAITGGLLTAWIALQRAPATSPIIQIPWHEFATITDVSGDDLLFTVAFGDDSSAPTPLDDIRSRTETLRTTIDSGLDVSDLLSDEGTTQ